MKMITKSFFPVRLMPLLAAVVVLCAFFFSPVIFGEDNAKEPLALQLPAPTLKGTPEDLPKAPTIEPISDKPRPPFMVPKGVKNVAIGKPVTASVQPFNGEFSPNTDAQ